MVFENAFFNDVIGEGWGNNSRVYLNLIPSIF